jgi:radical SAM superfamily enzyme YgiQ (UPF0313 family)
MSRVRALLISTYDLGRQPFGLASPAAWLRREGVDVACIDTSRDPLDDEQIADAGLVAFYLPMHTATRLAGPLIDRVRRINPNARVAAYGLYAPLNADWLRERGVTDVIGPEAEAELVDIVKSQIPNPESQIGNLESRIPTAPIQRLRFITPDRAGLPPLSRYAALQMPNGTRRVVGSTDATRGCKHLCRHCPIVPVYRGAFRAVPIDVVMADVHAQVAAGAQHISFADPDFFNGPTHARRIVERLSRELPGVSYDVTIKIEHLLTHAALLPLLRDTGCLFVTSAVEAVDDEVLRRLRKGHTRNDFVRAVALCRAAGVTLAPTFVPFTPWTTLEGYGDLISTIEQLDLIEEVAPIQLAIRLLVTSESALLELEDIRTQIDAFDPVSLTYPWRHRHSRVDDLQQQIMSLVGTSAERPRADVFHEIATLARGRACVAPTAPRRRTSRRVPHMTEAWYCCAEPGPELQHQM